MRICTPAGRGGARWLKRLASGAAVVVGLGWGIVLGAGLGAADAAAPINGWEPVGISGGGSMYAPAISPADPNLMMLNCDMSGAYLSRDGGVTWQLIPHLQLASSTRCRPGFHPSDSNTIYAAHGWWGGMRVSRDAGDTWEAVPGAPEALVGEIGISSYDPSLMLVGTETGASLSLDEGLTWHTCSGPSGEAIGVFLEPAAAGAMVVATTQGIWRSDDGGDTWALKVSGLPSTEIRYFSAGGAGPEMVLYCAIPSWEEGGAFAGGVYRSRDRGETWESAMGAGINKETQAYDEWADGAIAQYQQVLTTNAQPDTVYATNTSTGFWPPHHATVYRSDDAGDNWWDTFFPDPRGDPYNVTPNWLTATLGQNWPGAPDGAAICDSDPDRIITVDSMRAYVTHDGGDTWFSAFTLPAAGETPGPGSAWDCNGLVVTTTWHYYIDPFESDRHYIAYTDIGFARSLDAGESWIWWEGDKRPPWQNTCYELAFDPEIPGKMWGAFSTIHDIPNDNIISERHNSYGPGGVALSTDFAETWQVVATGLPDAPATSIVVDPNTPAGNRTLYLGVFEHGVYKSTDDGQTWTAKNNGLGAPDNMRVYRVILHPDGTLFALVTAKRVGGDYLHGGAGLYRSRDGAETWESITADLDLIWPKDFAVSPDSSDVIFLGAADGWGWPNPGGQSGLYRTTDGGVTWQRVAREGPQHFGAYFHPARPGWLYMTLTEGAPGHSLWLSQDNGDTWRPMESFPFTNPQRVEFDRADPDTIYVTTFGASVLRGRADERLATFSDVLSDHWAFEQVEACAAAGIVAGFDDGTYRPSLPVDRASMAVYISRALAGGDEYVPTAPATATFSDVPTDHWAYKYVEYAADQTIVGGYDDDTYRPAVQVTRDQMAVFIARAVVTPTGRPDLPSYTPPETATFSDVATDHWAYKYIEYIAQASVAVSQGYDDGTYRPDVVVTRDQMAVYVQRAFKLAM